MELTLSSGPDKGTVLVTFDTLEVGTKFHMFSNSKNCIDHYAVFQKCNESNSGNEDAPWNARIVTYKYNQYLCRFEDNDFVKVIVDEPVLKSSPVQEVVIDSRDDIADTVFYANKPITEMSADELIKYMDDMSNKANSCERVANLYQGRSNNYNTALFEAADLLKDKYPADMRKYLGEPDEKQE